MQQHNAKNRNHAWLHAEIVPGRLDATPSWLPDVTAMWILCWYLCNILLMVPACWWRIGVVIVACGQQASGQSNLDASRGMHAGAPQLAPCSRTRTYVACTRNAYLIKAHDLCPFDCIARSIQSVIQQNYWNAPCAHVMPMHGDMWGRPGVSPDPTTKPGTQSPMFL